MGQIKYILYWPNLIQVYRGSELIYEGCDWRLAQLSIVPF